MNDKKEAEVQEINESLHKMETRSTACVDTKVDEAIKATCRKRDKGYAEVTALQPKEATNVLTYAGTNQNDV